MRRTQPLVMLLALIMISAGCARPADEPSKESPAAEAPALDPATGAFGVRPPYYTVIDGTVVITKADGNTLSPIKLSLNVPSNVRSTHDFGGFKAVVAYQAKPRFRIDYVEWNGERIPEGP